MIMALCTVPALTFGQAKFKIAAKVGDYSAPVKAFLLYRVDGKLVRDSAILDHGKFNFEGAINYPSQAQLILDHKGEGLSKLGRTADVTSIYLDKSNIVLNAKDSVKNATLSGSKINDESKKYKELTAAEDNEIAQINNDFRDASDEEKQDELFNTQLKDRFDQANQKKHELQVQFIKQNPASYISLLVLMDYAGQSFEPATIEPLYKSLSQEILASPSGQAFAKVIEAAKATAIGATAPEFSQNDTKDLPVSLSSFRGKYVLLDFWASWCLPCRKENPNLVKSYNDYKDKNFTVLGISLDQPGKKEAWMNAIKDDGLVWTQVSDLKFWENAAAKLYGVRAIPQNFLLDPSGKIVAKNLRGDALNAKLAELLK